MSKTSERPRCDHSMGRLPTGECEVCEEFPDTDSNQSGGEHADTPTHECQFCDLQGDGLTLSRHRQEAQHLIRLIADRDRYTTKVGGERELLPCPFCGAQATSTEGDSPEFWGVYCSRGLADGCQVAPHTGWWRNREEAEALWNTRLQPSLEVAGLRQLAERAAEKITGRCLVYYGDLDGEPRMSQAAPLTTAKVADIILSTLTGSEASIPDYTLREADLLHGFGQGVEASLKTLDEYRANRPTTAGCKLVLEEVRILVAALLPTGHEHDQKLGK